MKQDFEIKVTSSEDYDLCNSCFELGVENKIMSRAFVADKVIYAEKEGKLIGFLSVDEDLVEGDLSLTSMAIKKGYEDKGVAMALFDYVLHHSQNVSKILSSVHLENESALNIYEKLDFVPAGDYDFELSGEKLNQIEDRQPLVLTENVTFEDEFDR